MSFSGKERVKKGTVKFWHDMYNVPRGWTSATEFSHAVIVMSGHQPDIDHGVYGSQKPWKANLPKPSVSLSNIGASVSNHVLSENQLASHDHDIYTYSSVSGYNNRNGSKGYDKTNTNEKTSNSGSNQGHNHGVSIDQPVVTVGDVENLEIKTKFIGMIRKL